MIIEKSKLEEKLEVLLKKFGNNIEILGKDIADAILFINIYCGDEKVVANEIELIVDSLQKPRIINSNYNKDGSETKVKKVGNQTGILYSIGSYKQGIKLNVIISKQYFKIEKLFEDELNYYCAEYVFDEKANFIRYAKQQSNPLGKKLSFEEISEGNFNRGVCFCEIKENFQEMKVKIFKIPTLKGEELYYSYFSKPDLFFQYKVPKRISKIPSITSIGMKDLNQLLEKQFSEDFIKFEDESLFKKLEMISKTKLKEQK